MGYRVLAWIGIGILGWACAGPSDGALVGESCREKKCRDGLKCGGASFECMAKDSCVDSSGNALDGNCEGGQVCVTDPKADNFGVCLAGGDCANEFRAEPVEPNVMLLLDRSGSMDEGIEGEGMKWHIAKDALQQITTAFEGKIRFGLAVFSACTDGAGCSAGIVEVPVGNDVAPIHEFLDDADDDFLCHSGMDETSIGASIDSVGEASSWKEAGREHALVLITDGRENCEGDGPEAAAEILALSPSVRTFVVGFTQDPDNPKSVNVEELSSIATHGGTEQHYLATNTAELEQALDAIGGTASLSCTHTLKDNVPEEGTKIYVYFDASLDALAEDPTNGWTYDPATTTVTLHGTACEQVKSSEVDEVVVSYDCKRGEF